jgi:predicted lactoylglutathione lyase
LANVITLGAVDFVRLRGFYQALKWPQVVDDEDFAAFELRGAVLALFAATRLAADGRADPDLAHPGLRFTIAVMAPSRDDLDQLVDKMRAAGAVVTKEPTDAEFFEGRSAYVADPEGNFWEIAWAPDDNAIVAAAKRAAGITPEPPSEAQGRQP